LEIRDLEYLLASANAGNFGRAAKALGLNTSTLSRRIGKLEDELGLALFERRRSGVHLTTGGKAVLQRARRVLAELDGLKHSSGQGGAGDGGEIRLGLRLPLVGDPLVGLLAKWHDSHPHVTLIVSELNERDLATGIEERALDVAVLPSHFVWPHTASIPLYRERLLVAVPETHVLSQRPSVGWHDLRNETILVQGWDESQAARELFATFLGSGSRFQSHAASKQSVFALVSAGFGITLAAASQAAAQYPGVMFKPIDDPNAAVQIALVWLPGREDAAIGRFVAVLRDEARRMTRGEEI
jgi:DNA-binding transcriptional LysR family regulator